MREKVIIRVEIFKEGDQYVSLCPELNVSSFGDTPEAAKKSLKEAVNLFLEECKSLGTLKEVLEEAGFSHQRRPVHIWAAPNPIAMEKLEVNFAFA